MNCADAREQLLEADPAELRGEGETELSLHVRECAACGAVAARLVAATLELNRTLEAVQPGVPVDAALRELRGRLRRERRRHRRLAGTIAVAAAATLAGLVLLRNGQPVVETDRQPSVVASPGLEVEAPPGNTVAVFEVADRPDIVIVWLFEMGEQSE